MASRAQLVLERIRPALETGKVVLCDRFVTATIAYQGACGIDPGTIIELGRVATEGLWPDLTVILQVPAEVGMGRLLTDRTRPKSPRQVTAEINGHIHTGLAYWSDRTGKWIYPSWYVTAMEQAREELG